MQLSKRLRQLQGDKSQAQFAQEIGISQSMLFQILQGKNVAISDQAWQTINDYIKRNAST